MCDEFTQADLDRSAHVVDRRGFAALAGAGALAAIWPTKLAASDAAVGRDVQIATSDGLCDGYFAAPATGDHPGVLIWPDIRGLRPVFRQMTERLAADGFAVLCVNPFYRSASAPVVQPGDDFSDPAIRQRLTGFARQLDEPAVRRDAAAFLAFIDAQPAVNVARGIGVSGYCMGGPMAIYTAASVPDRIAAVASFHGGGVASDKPDSPHLLIAGTKAADLFAIADNDDARHPEEKKRLKDVLEPRAQWHEVEVYQGAMHGWCPPDSRAYDEVAAEKAWGRMLRMFKASL